MTTAVIEIVPAKVRGLGRLRSPAKRPYYLRMVAANGEPLSVSERYSSISNARRGAGAWVVAMREITTTPDTVIEVSE